MLINEIEELGFQLLGKIENRGVHFEKYRLLINMGVLRWNV